MLFRSSEDGREEDGAQRQMSGQVQRQTDGSRARTAEKRMGHRGLKGGERERDLPRTHRNTKGELGWRAAPPLAVGYGSR